jgi:hypothetical protein
MGVRRSRIVVWLCSLIGVLALAAAGIGLFWTGQGGPVSFTAARGETVTLHGQGLYRYDLVFTAAGYKGQDAVTLLLAIPLLAVTTVLTRRGSQRGGLLLAGVLAWFLYAYLSMAFGAAYNSLFLVYVVLFSASFFALVRLLTSIDLSTLPAQILARLPRRGPAIFMVAAGLVTLLVWLGPLVGGMLEGRPPDLLGHYTTMVTDAIDLALITPTTIVAGTLILQRKPLGYVIAFPLLGLIVLLLPAITLMTVFQVQAGVVFTPGEIVGPIAGFATLGLFAVWVGVAILRRIPDSVPA